MEQQTLKKKRRRRKNSRERKSPLPRNIDSLLLIYLLYIVGFIYLKVKISPKEKKNSWRNK